MMGCFQGHFLTQSSNTILIQTTQTISQFILVSTYVYFTTQNGPKRQNNKSQFIFLKVECWVLKNHNCFVLYLNCNLLFSRKIFFTKCYIFHIFKKFVKTQIKIFSLDFFSCITSCSHKMYKIKTRIILCFFWNVQPII